MAKFTNIIKRLTASFFSISAFLIFVVGLFHLDLQMMAVSIIWLFIGGGFAVSIVAAFEEMYNDQQEK